MTLPERTSTSRSAGHRKPDQRPVPPLSEAEAFTQAEFLKALADPIRLRILHFVGGSDNVVVDDLDVWLPVQFSTIQHHVRILCQAGLLTKRQRQGPWVYYSLNRARLQQARELLHGLA